MLTPLSSHHHSCAPHTVDGQIMFAHWIDLSVCPYNGRPTGHTECWQASLVVPGPVLSA